MRVLRHISRKLLVLAAALLVIPSGGALASQAYPEQVGDAPGGAPDISAVTVSHKLAGTVTFAVSFANRTTLAGEDFMVLSLDSDRDRSTGQYGEDYWIGVDGGAPASATLFVNMRLIILPAGTVDWIPVPVMDLPATWADKTVTVSVAKDDVDIASAFDFGFLSHTGGDMTTANTEVVPHSGWWTYSLSTVIDQVQLGTPVSKVKAGKVFALRGVTVKLSTDEVFAPETLSATAKVAGKQLKPLAGGLSWKVPKSARGKKLVVTLNAAYQGMQKTQMFTMKIVK